MTPTERAKKAQKQVANKFPYYYYQNYFDDNDTSNEKIINTLERHVYEIIDVCLTPKQKTYFLQKYRDRMKQKDIATLNGVSEACVSRVLKRGCKSIRAYGEILYNSLIELSRDYNN